MAVIMAARMVAAATAATKVAPIEAVTVARDLMEMMAVEGAATERRPVAATDSVE